MKICLQIRLAVFGSLAIVSTGVALAQSIAITDEDTSQPVACYVNGVPPDGKSVSLGRTDPPGQFKFTGTCVEGYALQFIPQDGSIYYQASLFCKEALANGVRLKKISMPDSGKLNALIQKGYEFKSDPGSAAFASALLANAVYSEAEVRSYKITTLVQFGKFLNVQKPVTYNGMINDFVASDDLVNATKTFQSHKGVTVTGIIDDKTLKLAVDPGKIDQFFKKQ
jgi:hypothetical protein